MSTFSFMRTRRCTVALSLLLCGSSMPSTAGNSIYVASTGLHGVRGSKVQSVKVDDGMTARQVKDLDHLPPMLQTVVDPRLLTSKNSGSSIESAFEDCAAACDPAHRDLTYGMPKPTCCSGGLSALKVVYHGPTGKLSVPNDHLIDSDVNKCETMSRHDNQTMDYVRFADCDRCFPATNGLCDVALDTSTTLFVETGKDICLVLIDLETNRSLPDEKFPTNTQLFFEYPANDVVMSTIIHTSCSKPIHPPFGVRIGKCRDDENYSIDLSTSTLAMDVPALEFIDGASRNNPDSLFSDCLSSKVRSTSENCCSGGASYIKARLMGSTLGGFLTINPAKLSSSQHCGISDSAYRTKKNKGKKGKSSRSRDDPGDTSGDSGHSFSINTRFVHCNDECLSDPFNVQCSTFLEGQDVGLGEEFCIVSFDSEEAAFSNKLPTNLWLWFVPETGGSAVQSLMIHTSCSQPLIGFAQTFGSGCDAFGSSNVDLSYSQVDQSIVYIEFRDGISTDYFDTARRYDSSSFLYDISFADCGCACPPLSSPTYSRSPLSSPVASLTMPIPTRTPGQSPSITPMVPTFNRLPDTSPLASSMSSTPNRSSGPSPLASSITTTSSRTPVSSPLASSTSPTRSPGPSQLASATVPTPSRSPGTSPSTSATAQTLSLSPLPTPVASSTAPTPDRSPGASIFAFSMAPSRSFWPTLLSSSTASAPSRPPGPSPLTSSTSLNPSRTPGSKTGASTTPSILSSILFSDLNSDVPSSPPTTKLVVGGTSDDSNRPSFFSSNEPATNRPPGSGTSLRTSQPTESPLNYPNNSSVPSVLPSSTAFTDHSSSPSPSLPTLTYSPSPSDLFPTHAALQSKSPGRVPSVEATEPRPLGPPGPPSGTSLTDEECSTLCSDWVLKHCIRVGDNGDPLLGFACDVSANDLDDEGRRWMESSPIPFDQDHEKNLRLLHQLLLFFPID